ncbi:family 78 glycoside hydrolase catalytic domain [Lachnospiraceae bacterium 29-91]
MFEKWITNGTAKPFYARRELVIEKTVKRASAKVCGLGQFHFYINGKKVSDHELDPAWTDYRKLIYYVPFDVTDMLRPGKNVIGAEVGNGWFIKCDEHYTFTFPGFMPPNPNPYRPCGDSLILAMELCLEYEDGTRQVIGADDRFRVKEHPVVMSNVYGSERIDGRLAQPGWCETGFDDSAWQQALYVPEDEVPRADILEQTMPPVKVIKSYEGTLLHQVNGKDTGKIRDIYDFGQNMSGILELEVRGNAGDTVRIYPAEKLGKNGDADQEAKGWCTVDSCITCIVGQKGVWEKFRMTFTYFAGRFVGVEKDGGAEIRNLRAHAITSAHKTDGTFSCDDERYNRIYDMIEKTVEANMVGVHTDCPTIERFAWQEPNHLMAGSIFYMKDGKLLWEKFLRDMRYAQHTKDDYFLDYEGKKVYPGEGLMPSQCPCYIPNVLPVPGMGSFYDIIPWGSTCILGTYWHYRFYGDVSIIEDNYDAGMSYFRHLLTKVNEEGFINHGLGDWGNPKNELARENVETAFLYADAVCLAEFAEVLKKPEDRRSLLEKAEEIRENYNAKLMVRHPEKGFWCYRCVDREETLLTQAAQALPLFWNMVPKERKEDVIQALRYTLEREGAFIAGEIGLPYIIQCARIYGMNELVSRFILRETHPSYYAFILDGETTLGEYWESNPRSHCHDMMGHIIEWYYNGIAGIIPEEPGFAKVTIRPCLPESIHEFDCTYQSVRGRIRVHVKDAEEEIVLETEVPEGVEMRVDVSELEGTGKKVVISYIHSSAR